MNVSYYAKHLALLCAFLGIFGLLSAQSSYSITTAEEKMKAFESRKNLIQNSPVKAVPFRNVGPTVMSGRVTDLAVNPDAPREFYVAYASGGLWYTKTNGIDFTPLFDHQASMTIGDIAVIWGETNKIWVGTGENNSSRSSYAGTGLYYSADAGKNWEHKGLGDTQHIGRIIVHENDANTVYVAAIGNLYSNSDDRGVYKTTDNGSTWAKTLYINDNTGAIDLVVSPENPNTMMASMWERKRQAWHFQGNGEGSSIWKTVDGGTTWEKLTTKNSGFPTTEGVGRIGLAYAPSDANIVYAMLDNQDFRDKSKEEAKYEITKDKLREMSDKAFLKLSDEAINDFLDRMNFPNEFNAYDIKEDVKSGKIKPVAIVEYTEDANAMLFDTPIKGGEMYRSNDGGKTWAKTHEDYIERLVNTYGYYFGEVRVDAQNPDVLYTMGVPLIQSKDGGKTWKSISQENVHADHHALWVNPKMPGHLVNGNDGGVNISYDDGETWFKANSPAVGQFYTVNVDMAKPYNVYGGLQDNGVWFGSSRTNENRAWHQSGKHPFSSIMGGDGMQVAIDTRDNATVYTGYQFGNYFRVNTETDERKYITPKHTLGERPLRWNWQSPIIVSSHNQDVVYFGSNKFHRSLNQGNDFEALSNDLTKGGKKGNVPYGTLTSISESPLKFGLLYVGSDDGYIHRSEDAGYTWNRISDALPQDLWVSRVYASHHDKNRVYASLNGYRFDHADSYVYRSDDMGKTWKKIMTDLPAEAVNVIKEDPHHENLLFVGTDHQVYMSLDGGKTSVGFSQELPDVAVHDLVIHPRDKDLILGTHGRSIFIADLEPIYDFVENSSSLKLLAFDKQTANTRWGMDFGFGRMFEPSVDSWLIAPKKGAATLKVLHESGLVLHEQKLDAENGLNAISYDLSVQESATAKYMASFKTEEAPKMAENGQLYLSVGKYSVVIEQDGQTSETMLEIAKPRERPARKPQKKTP